MTTSTQWADVRGAGQYTEMYGVNLHMETYGEGRPMILLQGGDGSGEMFGPILPRLSQDHQAKPSTYNGTGAPRMWTVPSTSGSWPTRSGRSSTTSAWTGTHGRAQDRRGVPASNVSKDSAAVSAPLEN